MKKHTRRRFLGYTFFGGLQIGLGIQYKRNWPKFEESTVLARELPLVKICFTNNALAFLQSSQQRIGYMTPTDCLKPEYISDGRYIPSSNIRLYNQNTFFLKNMNELNRVAFHETIHVLDLGAKLVDRDKFRYEYERMPATLLDAKSAVEYMLEKYYTEKADFAAERIAFLAEEWIINGKKIPLELQKSYSQIIHPDDQLRKMIETRRNNHNPLDISG